MNLKDDGGARVDGGVSCSEAEDCSRFELRQS